MNAPYPLQSFHQMRNDGVCFYCGKHFNVSVNPIAAQTACLPGGDEEIVERMLPGQVLWVVGWPENEKKVLVELRKTDLPVILVDERTELAKVRNGIVATHKQ
jgi:hypothetical protein